MRFSVRYLLGLALISALGIPIWLEWAKYGKQQSQLQSLALRKQQLESNLQGFDPEWLLLFQQRQGQFESLRRIAETLEENFSDDANRARQPGEVTATHLVPLVTRSTLGSYCRSCVTVTIPPKRRVWMRIAVRPSACDPTGDRTEFASATCVGFDSSNRAHAWSSSDRIGNRRSDSDATHLRRRFD